QLRNLLAIIIFACSIVTILISLYLARSITRPVINLTHVARKISEGDLSARAEATSTDEIGTLGQAFNQMAENLVTDIAKRKKSEEALRESEEKYRLLFENVFDVIFSYDQELRVLSVSPSVERVLGYKPEELIGRSFSDLNILAPEYLESAISDAMRIFAGESIESSVYEFIAKDRTRKFCEISGTPLIRDGKVLVGVSVGRDITDKKLAEVALHREKEKFRILVEESPLGVSLIGKDGDYKYVNPKFVEIFGYTLEEIPTGQEWFRKTYPDPEYRNKAISTWITDVKESEPGQFRSQTFTVTCKDGLKKVIQFLPVTMETGDHFIIYDDITEKEKLGAQLRQAQKMEAVGMLAGGVAHDFNNLLTCIIGNADLMLMSLSKDSPLNENIGEIMEAGQRAASLTRQLLAFSRKQVFQLKVLNISSVVTELKKMLGRLIGEDVKVETFLEPDLMQVEADPVQVQQVIMNLAVNARDAMPRGGKLTIETANVYLDETYAHDHEVELKTGPYVMLAVSDTGFGMDEKTRSRIFEPFFTTKEKGEGTGLGLSTVYGIVKQSGGYIWVYSEPEQGTTFKIYMPGVEREAEPVKRQQTSLEGLRGSENVLLVEDDKTLRNLAVKVLKQYGYSVIEAQHGEQALSICDQHEGPIHLMITDVVMPGMSGRELAGRLQSLRPEIKVLYMSGYTDNVIVHHGVLAPGVNFIEKPFSPGGLVRKVREVLDGK
ncbi:MAG: PAS domain S-box protein, partial [Proteobacteria bacterium]|nr:PAS domain S-box protein [Pseudomonadota bacterium]